MSEQVGSVTRKKSSHFHGSPVTGNTRIFQKLMTGKNRQLVFMEVPVTNRKINYHLLFLNRIINPLFLLLDTSF